jgi:hypothetical protein
VSLSTPPKQQKLNPYENLWFHSIWIEYLPIIDGLGFLYPGTGHKGSSSGTSLKQRGLSSPQWVVISGVRHPTTILIKHKSRLLCYRNIYKMNYRNLEFRHVCIYGIHCYKLMWIFVVVETKMESCLARQLNHGCTQSIIVLKNQINPPLIQLLSSSTIFIKETLQFVRRPKKRNMCSLSPDRPYFFSSRP